MYLRTEFESAALYMRDANHEATRTATSKHLCASAYDMLAGDASKKFDAIVDKRAFEHDGVLVSTNFDQPTCMI